MACRRYDRMSPDDPTCYVCGMYAADHEQKTPILYQVQMSKTPGYGHRIWITPDRVTFDVTDGLKKFSKWGGADKTDDFGISWEFGDAELVEALNFLNCIGR